MRLVVDITCYVCDCFAVQCFSYLMEKLQLVNMKPDFLNRNVNEGFSGGERKRNEILQLAVLGADLAILDEIDSGLDVDALRDVANAVNRILTPQNSLLMITHYRRILDLLNPTHVHVMVTYRFTNHLHCHCKFWSWNTCYAWVFTFRYWNHDASSITLFFPFYWDTGIVNNPRIADETE